MSKHLLTFAEQYSITFIMLMTSVFIPSFMLLFGLGMQEVILIVFLFLLLFGAKRIPDLMKSMGKGVRSFKEGINEVQKELDTDTTKPDSSAKQEDKEN